MLFKPTLTILLAGLLLMAGCEQPAAPPATPSPAPPTTSAPIPLPPPSTPDATTPPAPMPKVDPLPPAVPMPTPPVTPPAAPPADSKPTSSKTPAAPATAPATDAVAETKAAAAPVAVDLATFPDAALLGEGVVGMAVVHPQQILKWPVIEGLRKAGLLKEMEAKTAELQLKPEVIARITLVVDQELVDTLATAAGMTKPGEAPAEVRPEVLQNNLKQVALAVHNFESAHRHMPSAEGMGDGKSSGLSWRVWLLPYIEQVALYNQFKHDEPWDSEHNKTLIDKMPAIYRTPGVDDPTKTALHVFTGKGTLFDGKEGKKFQNITDGMSNTLLALYAGPDTAAEWTRPGGLEFNAKTCKAALGKISGESLPAVMSDGAARTFPTDIEQTLLANLIQIADGNVVELPPTGPARGLSIAMIPSVIVSFTEAFDPAGIVKHYPKADTVEGEAVHQNEFATMWQPNDKTVVFGTPAGVARMIQVKKSGKPATPSTLSQLDLGADLSVAVDLQSQTALIEQAVARNPMFALALQVQSLALQANVTQPVGGKLIEIVATTADEKSAQSLTQIFTQALDQGKTQMANLRLPPPEPLILKGMAQKVVASSGLKQEGTRVVFLVPVPEGYEKLPELLNPAIGKAAEAAARSQRMNNLKMVGLAFHNYHDVYNKFPGAGRAADKDVALSWRVHLLPFLDQAPLYEQFHLDEPWDSAHNKTLIDKMPAVFKVAGVDKPGLTSVHVFTGKGAPFYEDRTPGIRDFTDGTSNTILTVEAGADKAEIWTKPGGLDFDREKAIEALGTLPGNIFLALLADGSVKTIVDKVDAATLRRLIEFQDGEVIDGL